MHTDPDKVILQPEEGRAYRHGERLFNVTGQDIKGEGRDLGYERQDCRNDKKKSAAAPRLRFPYDFARERRGRTSVHAVVLTGRANDRKPDGRPPLAERNLNTGNLPFVS